MARGPDGTLLDADAPAPAGITADEVAFATGLEKIIDRAMQRHPPDQSFVYGIHQGLPPRAAELLVARFRAAGWSDVVLRAGETGAHLLILHP